MAGKRQSVRSSFDNLCCRLEENNTSVKKVERTEQ